MTTPSLSSTRPPISVRLAGLSSPPKASQSAGGTPYTGWAQKTCRVCAGPASASRVSSRAALMARSYSPTPASNVAQAMQPLLFSCALAGESGEGDAFASRYELRSEEAGITDKNVADLQMDKKEGKVILRALANAVNAMQEKLSGDELESVRGSIDDLRGKLDALDSISLSLEKNCEKNGKLLANVLHRTDGKSHVCKKEYDKASAAILKDTQALVQRLMPALADTSKPDRSGDTWEQVLFDIVLDFEMLPAIAAERRVNERVAIGHIDLNLVSQYRDNCKGVSDGAVNNGLKVLTTFVSQAFWVYKDVPEPEKAMPSAPRSIPIRVAAPRPDQALLEKIRKLDPNVDMSVPDGGGPPSPDAGLRRRATAPARLHNRSSDMPATPKPAERPVLNREEQISRVAKTLPSPPDDLSTGSPSESVVRASTSPGRSPSSAGEPNPVREAEVKRTPGVPHNNRQTPDGVRSHRISMADEVDSPRRQVTAPAPVSVPASRWHPAPQQAATTPVTVGDGPAAVFADREAAGSAPGTTTAERSHEPPASTVPSTTGPTQNHAANRPGESASSAKGAPSPTHKPGDQAMPETSGFTAGGATHISINHTEINTTITNNTTFNIGGQSRASDGEKTSSQSDTATQTDTPASAANNATKNGGRLSPDSDGSAMIVSTSTPTFHSNVGTAQARMQDGSFQGSIVSKVSENATQQTRVSGHSKVVDTSDTPATRSAVQRPKRWPTVAAPATLITSSRGAQWDMKVSHMRPDNASKVAGGAAAVPARSETMQASTVSSLRVDLTKQPLTATRSQGVDAISKSVDRSSGETAKKWPTVAAPASLITSSRGAQWDMKVSHLRPDHSSVNSGDAAKTPASIQPVQARRMSATSEQRQSAKDTLTQETTRRVTSASTTNHVASATEGEAAGSSKGVQNNRQTGLGNASSMAAERLRIIRQQAFPSGAERTSAVQSNQPTAPRNTTVQATGIANHATALKRTRVSAGDELAASVKAASSTTTAKSATAATGAKALTTASAAKATTATTTTASVNSAKALTTASVGKAATTATNTSVAVGAKPAATAEPISNARPRKAWPTVAPPATLITSHRGAQWDMKVSHMRPMNGPSDNAGASKA